MNSDPTARIEAIAAVIAEPLPFEYSYFLSQCGGFVGMDVDNGSSFIRQRQRGPT